MAAVESEVKITVPPPETLTLGGNNWNIVKRLMFGDYLPYHWHAEDGNNGDATDYSYTGQLGLLGISNEHVLHAPDLVLFTSRSAIPVADAVRGSFEEYGKPMPQLGIINCSDRAQTMFQEDEKKRAEEIERLKSLEVGNRNVVVVEQFINYGYGIKYASNLLLDAGFDAAQISFMKGRWYHDLGSVTFDPVAVTSGAAVGMRNIGRKSIARLG